MKTTQTKVLVDAALAGYAARNGLVVGAKYSPEGKRLADHVRVLARKGKFVVERTKNSVTVFENSNVPDCHYLGFDYPAGVRLMEATELLCWLEAN